MSTIIKNGKEYYPFWITTIYGVERGYSEIGPAPKISKFDRVLMFMREMEKQNNTDSPWYQAASKRASQMLCTGKYN